MWVTRALRPEDFARVDTLLQAAYQRPHSFVQRLQRQLDIQPDGWFVIGNPEIMGVGGVTVMDSVGYIGLVGVDPGAQRQGIATALMTFLMQWAQEHGCQTYLLDASQAGEPLYARLGFAASDLVEIWRLDLPHAPAVERVSPNVRPYTATDLPALLACDARCSGMLRPHCLEPYITEATGSEPNRDGGRMWVIAAEQRIGGYLILQQNDTIGPWVAEHAAMAEQLLNTALTHHHGASFTVMMPGKNSAGQRMLQRSGFQRVRHLTHMIHGKALPDERRQRVFGQLSLSVG